MKQSTKIFLSTYLFVVIGVMAGCGSSGGGGDKTPDTIPDPQNPNADTGTLTVTNAPLSIGNRFIPTTIGGEIKGNGNNFSVGWSELNTANNSHLETIAVTHDLATSQVTTIFSVLDGGVVGTWSCSDLAGGIAACRGVAIDKTAGTVTFANQVLTSGSGSSTLPITLNGTLTFTPPIPTPTPTPGPTPVPTPTPPPGGTIKGNNSALLSGAVIGSGTQAVASLRKQITSTVLGANTSFTVGTAYATRSSTNSGDYAHIILPVTNIGTQTLCFVKLAGVTYRNASGTAIGVPDRNYVNGSVGKLASGIFTNTCLAPGETGMVADIKASLYTAVATMEFTFESGSSAVSVPIASVIPQSYTIPSTSSLPAINVKNVGTGSAKFSLSTVFLLDAAEQPLMWSFATVTSVVVPVSGTATMSSGLFYDGSGSKLLAFVDFVDATASMKQTFGVALPPSDICSAFLPADEFSLCMNESRKQGLESLESSYNAQLSTP